MTSILVVEDEARISTFVEKGLTASGYAPTVVGSGREALDYLATFKPEDIDGTENKEITLKRGDRDVTMTGQDYLLGRAQMNVWFHVTTAYNILRNNGVPLGKSDFSR